MKISAVIIVNEKSATLERCLKTVCGWTSEILLVSNSFNKISKNLVKKYGAKVLIFEENKEKMIRMGIKYSKADWVVVLNSFEEVSIPLKIEMRMKLSSVMQNSVNVNILKNDYDIWKPKPSIETRIFKRYTWQKSNKSAIFNNSIREWVPQVLPEKPLFKKQNIKKILVIKLRGIGDTVLMTPLVSNLKRYYKEASITCVITRPGKEILKNNSNVNRIITFDGFFDTFLQVFMAGRFDMVICPQASRKSALLSLAARAPVKIVNNHNGRNYFTTVRVGKPEEYEDAIDRDLDCLRTIGIPVKTKKVEVNLLKNEKYDIRKYGFSGKDKLIGISVSASRKNKMWFKERFAELADKLIKDYNFKIIFIEDPKDPDALKQVIRLMKNKPFTICERNLRKVMALLSGFDLFIGNDSGLLHIAVALEIPSISIVGPEEAVIFNPYSEKDRHYVLSADLDCKPCWKDDCILPLCLDAISVDQVLKSVLKAVK
ncbi:MAG: hypothetical protein A2231_09445 [Candidatus Firestonebacteria bacterium RIFOXYA2_FULL_40_8]|nr:MAG: hypothetical protein A2231_09445 [Candidatus Firestonebacteria bacterium RIFOXYA2_FULL_40_8]